MRELPGRSGASSRSPLAAHRASDPVVHRAQTCRSESRLFVWQATSLPNNLAPLRREGLSNLRSRIVARANPGEHLPPLRPVTEFPTETRRRLLPRQTRRLKTERDINAHRENEPRLLYSALLRASDPIIRYFERVFHRVVCSLRANNGVSLPQRAS